MLRLPCAALPASSAIIFLEDGAERESVSTQKERAVSYRFTVQPRTSKRVFVIKGAAWFAFLFACLMQRGQQRGRAFCDDLGLVQPRRLAAAVPMAMRGAVLLRKVMMQFAYSQLQALGVLGAR
jgi:hypothetical protein